MKNMWRFLLSELCAFVVCMMFMLNLKLFIMVQTTYNLISTTFWFFVMFCFVWYAFYYKLTTNENGNIKKREKDLKEDHGN